MYGFLNKKNWRRAFEGGRQVGVDPWLFGFGDLHGTHASAEVLRTDLGAPPEVHEAHIELRDHGVVHPGAGLDGFGLLLVELDHRDGGRDHGDRIDADRQPLLGADGGGDQGGQGEPQPGQHSHTADALHDFNPSLPQLNSSGGESGCLCFPLPLLPPFINGANSGRTRKNSCSRYIHKEREYAKNSYS